MTSIDPSLTSSASESDEKYFDSGLFGLFHNPGVVRFCCDDYPEEVSEYCDDEVLAASEHKIASDWIRISYDNLNLDSNTVGDNINDIISNKKLLSLDP